MDASLSDPPPRATVEAKPTHSVPNSNSSIESPPIPFIKLPGYSSSEIGALRDAISCFYQVVLPRKTIREAEAAEVLQEFRGKYTEAEPLFKRSLKIWEKVLGPVHPNVATSLGNLAVFYQAQGRYAEAESFYKRVLTIVEKALGPRHPIVATVCENIAELYKKIGKEGKAKKLEKRARKIRSNQ